MIAKGIDPAVIEAERRAAEACERAIRVKHSFANVAETFIADKLAQERRGKSAERDLRSIFVAAWGDRPIGKITKRDVLESINAKKRSAPHMARALFIIVARFFNWRSTNRPTASPRRPATGLASPRSSVPRRRAPDALTTMN